MLSLRCGGPCPPLALIRQEMVSAAPGTRVIRLEPADTPFLAQLARPRATAALSFAFAAIALLAAAGGLFSVLSYAVGRRRKEFGIRSAVGASPARLRGTVLRDGAWVTGIGLVLGVAGAASLTQVLSSLQYGMAPFDPVSSLIVAGTLLTTALLAAWRPAREAARADAVTLLRED